MSEPSQTTCNAAGKACGCSPSAPVPSAVPASEGKTVTYRIANMDCPSEEGLIRRKLHGMQGILDLRFNLMGRSLDVMHELRSEQPVTEALHSIGMKAVVVDESAPAPVVAEEAALSPLQKAGLGVAGLCAVAAEVLAWQGTAESSPPVIALSLISILTAGIPTLRKGWVALKTLTLNINFLMCLAVVGAVLIGQWPEAAMVIFLFAIAELIEAMSLDRARGTVHALLRLAPDEANVRDEHGQWRLTEADRIDVGAIVLVKPGERIAVDGEVIEGESSVNQAPITGESMPVAKKPGDAVYAGTINEHGLLEVRVTTQRRNSTLAKIVRVIEETQQNQAPTQRFVDTFAKYYTPAVVVAALLVAMLPPLLWHQPVHEWLYKALVMLVIACPCALVISTPVTVVSGLTAAAKQGILIKGGQFLEAGYKLKAIALDKTGTLTQGRPAVVSVAPAFTHSRDDVLEIAASLDANSDHPLARAVVAAVTPGTRLHRVQGFEAVAGRGVRGVIDGVQYYLGNQRLMTEHGVDVDAMREDLAEQEAAGRTAVMLASETGLIGMIAIADVLRDSAIPAIERLKVLGVTPVMLTGDNLATAQQIGRQVGIDQVHADLLPEQKLEAVDALEAKYGVVGMIGDGINDAPALARAKVGFAMGAAGSDTAIETADVALMDDDLQKLPAFVSLSKQTRHVLVQNIVLALGIKAVFFALALFGLATLWMAVFADVGASLLVVFNGLRLLRFRRAASSAKGA